MEMEERTRRALRVTGITAVAVVAVGTVAALIVRDQISRQRRNLFAPVAFKRMAALEHISRQHPAVDLVRLLQDYLAWEPRKLLRQRAQAIADRMASDLDATSSRFGEPVT